MAQIDERIEQRIRAFADELRELIREAAHQAIDQALAITASPSSSPRPRATPTASKNGRRPRPKGTRRTSEQMERDLDALRAHIRQHPGATALEIGATLGMANREITRPINKLLATGEIRKAGVKSHTRYYPADSAPREPRRNNSHPRSS